MPFYEYECSACKFYVEALQKISEPPLSKCPSCGKQTLQRLISAPVFRLKGGGWYETDFKSDKENKRNLAEDKEPAAKSDSDDKDDKKIKVRASKALKKVAAKKAAGKVAVKKLAKQTAAKTSGKKAKVVRRQPGKPGAAKRPLSSGKSKFKTKPKPTSKPKPRPRAKAKSKPARKK